LDKNISDIIVDSIYFARKRVMRIFRKDIASRSLGRNISGDITRYIDIVSEKSIIDFLKKSLKSFSILSEEAGFRKYGADYPLIIMDPIDGSFNASRGIPLFSISIAVAYGDTINDIVFGAVCNIATGDIYTGYKDKGAYLNNILIERNTKGFRPVVSIALSQNIYPKMNKFIRRSLDKGWKIRVIGSSSLEICMVADGSIDAYIDIRNMLRISDIAASILILNESKGRIYNRSIFNEVFLGEKRYNIVAANSQSLLDEILAVLEFINKSY